MQNSLGKPPALSSADKIQLTISYLLKAVMLFTILLCFLKFDFFLVFSGLLILVFSSLPSIVERTFRITLPVEVDLILTTFIFAHFVLGEFANYYDRIWWWDLLLHASSGILIGMVGFVIIYFFLFTSRVTANPALVSLFSVTFSLAAAMLWEIFEFLMDQLFGFTMQKSGFNDTMTDLIVAFLGACVVGIGVYRYLINDEDGLIKRTINRFILFNLRLKDRRLRRKRLKRARRQEV
jgi:hypothetical protein